MLFGKKKTVMLKVGGMHCEKCAAKVETALKNIGGRAEIDLKLGRVKVVCPEKLGVDAIKTAVEAVGFSCEVM